MVSFHYDSAGNLMQVFDSLGHGARHHVGTTRFGYDSFDRLTSVAQPAGAVSYQWDAAGNLLSRNAAGHTESYAWDNVDRLSAAKLDGKTMASYSYDLAHGSVTTRRPSGLVEVQTLDARDREIELRLTQAGTPVRSISSAYDAGDNLIRSNDSVAGKAAYSYDALGQLSEVCYGVDECSGDANEYIRCAYDGAGNKTWEQRPTGSTWSLYGSGSELLASITAPAAYPRVPPTAASFSYDADGNLTSDGTTSYTWSAAGKPTSSIADGVTTSYVHGGDGRRVSESAAGKTTQYLWDPLSPQILGTTQGKSTSRYGYGAGLVAQAAGGRTTEVVSGRSGSVLATGSAAVEHRDFEPYGAPRSVGGADSKSSGPGFTGGLQLPNGNYLMGQREYNPKTGVFLSPDQGGSDQAYGYASGNPISFSDLSGMDDVDGTLTDVSKISGWASTGALLAAVGCTLYRPCAPAVPIFMQVSAATGIAAGISGGVLDAKACVVKGNCSGVVVDVALTAAASRLPGLGAKAHDFYPSGAPARTFGTKSVSPYQIRFSQTSVNGADDIVASMKANGWVGNPIDVVRMPDGNLTSVDNTRVLSAGLAGVNARVRIHQFDSALDPSLSARFVSRKGDLPATWGEAVINRIGTQSSKYRTAYPFGSPYTGWKGNYR